VDAPVFTISREAKPGGKKNLQEALSRAFFHHGDIRAMGRILPAHGACRGRNGHQQVDSLFLDAAQKSGRVGFAPGGIAGGLGLRRQPIGLAS